ncbi:MAG: hypothetical protein V2B18_17730, partial [Pseudomonadota bacterium]
MQTIIPVLLSVCRLSLRFPRGVLCFFGILTLAGFAAMPYMTISTDLMEGVGESSRIIALSKENSRLFGEQDSLILVLEFPKPPGEGRLPFIRGIAEELSKLEGIRRVRYRFLD